MKEIMKETMKAMKAVFKLILTGLYAFLSYDAILISEIADGIDNPAWKKFWNLDAKANRSMADLARKFC